METNFRKISQVLNILFTLNLVVFEQLLLCIFVEEGT